MKPFAKIALLALCLIAPTAWAKTCAVTIAGNDQMKFDRSVIALAADCTEVKLTLKHTGTLAAKVMGHNWVLTRTADFMAVANAGLGAGFAAGYLPKGDRRVIAHTALIGGGQSTTISFPIRGLDKGGDYTFFCSFPGHWTLMNGTFRFG